MRLSSPEDWRGFISFKANIVCLGLLFSCSQNICAHQPTIEFPQACVKGTQIIIAAVGDILLHYPLQLKASRQGFTSLWGQALPFLQTADMTYGNLEGPIGVGVNHQGQEVPASEQWEPYFNTAFPHFNYHPSIAPALKTSGFNIISTANNHSLDRFPLGVDKTLATLEKAGLNSIGARPRQSQQQRLKIIEKKGIKVAWIACTQHTNGIVDKYQQILHCHQKTDRQWILQTIQQLKTQVDAIIVTPHWGEEYQQHFNAAQTQFAHQVLEAGASAVIGSHPHVLQGVEKYQTKDGRSTFISYSLGNFVSFQGTPTNRSTILLLLGLTKTSNGTIINGFRFVPMYMQNRNGTENIQLTRVLENSRYSVPYRIISQILPMGNALYSGPIVTNPQCP